MKSKMGRKRKINYLLIVMNCLVVTICFAGISTGTSEVKKETETGGRKIVAKVNGNPIYEDQLAPYVRKSLKSFQKFGGGKDTTALVKRLKKRALATVIGQELILQESQKMTVSDIEEKIEKKLQTMKSRYSSEEHFEKRLQAQHMTEKDLRESLKKQVYLDEYLKMKSITDPEVPEEEIRKFYDKDPGAFHREETVKASHILIKAGEDADPDEKEKAREQAEKIRKEIIEGGDFAEMAKKYSEDGKAPLGGDLGYIKRGYMPLEFDTVAFDLEEGTVSDIVETTHGYHIIKVYKKLQEGIAPFKEVKDFIGKFLQERLSQQKRASHIEELREKAKIEILLNES
jgi:peptidyl-prolyl cis-trans isomerase C